MSIGYRPQGAAGPMYNPERDFAYITPTLMKQAIENMSAPPNPEFEDWKKANNVTENEIILAAEALAAAQRDFVSTADPVDSLHQALQRRDYFALPLSVRLFLQAMIGEVMMGAWFKAVREVSMKGEESPAQNEMCRFTAAVREFSAARGAPVINANSTAETVLARQDVLLGRYEALRSQLFEEQQKRVKAEMIATAQDIELSRIPQWVRRFGRWISTKTDYTGPK